MYRVSLFLFLISSSLFPAAGTLSRVVLCQCMRGTIGSVGVPADRSLRARSGLVTEQKRLFFRFNTPEEQPASLASAGIRSLSEFVSIFKKVRDLVGDDNVMRQIMRTNRYAYSYRATPENSRIVWEDSRINIAMDAVLNPKSISDYMIKETVMNNDHELIEHLVSHGVEISYRQKQELLADASTYSVEVLRLLLKNIHKCSLHEYFNKEFWSARDIFDVNKLPGEIKVSERTEILKKVMLMINSGASPRPNDDKGSYRDVVGIKEKFPDLHEYLDAARLLRTYENDKRAKSRVSEVMKKYGIKEEDVTVVKKDKAESSRLQDSE